MKKIQAGYRGAAALAVPEASPRRPPLRRSTWPKIDKKSADADPFAYLNFVLQFCPPTGPAAVEVPLRARFAKIGIEAGKPFDVDKLTPEQKAELEAGMKSGLEKIKQHVGDARQGRERLARRHRAASATGRRTRGTSRCAPPPRWPASTATTPSRRCIRCSPPTATATSPTAASNRYTLTFPAGQLPPVNAFWSVTMYDGKTQLLIENPINRYLINSPMLPDLKKNADGSLTHLHPEGLAGQGQGVELAAGAGRPDLRGDAALLAEGGGAERNVEAAGRDSGQVNTPRVSEVESRADCGDYCGASLPPTSTGVSQAIGSSTSARHAAFWGMSGGTAARWRRRRTDELLLVPGHDPALPEEGVVDRPVGTAAGPVIGKAPQHRRHRVEAVVRLEIPSIELISREAGRLEDDVVVLP